MPRKTSSQSNKSTTKPTGDRPSLPEDWQYETASTEIEAIIDQLEQDDLTLDNAFSAFATAVQRLQECDQFLSDRQAQAEILIETLTDD
ncbi:MAG: exodeoxyribonuclease VII small subunit [Cyanobacteria bacterium P01_H01_bin.130]